MKKATGFITLHRQILDWEWYKHPHTAFLFIHLLLSANFVDGQFKGETIRRGQLVRSIPQLSTDTGLSIQQVKTALAHLRLTGEITDDTSRQYRVITVVKYDDYQKLTDKSTASQPPINRQPNRELTANSFIEQHQYNNNNNINNENKETTQQERVSAKRFTPPTKEQIFDFCLDNEINLDVDRFYDYYASKGWKVGSSPMKDWKAAVRNWVRRDKEKPAASGYGQKKVIAQQYEQRDYGDEDREAMERMLRMGGF